MQYCFIINPASGKEKTKEGLESRIREAAAQKGIEANVYFTTCRGDAREFVKNYSVDASDEVRFYACGGDGTLCECVSGLMDRENRDNVSVGVIPVGTGNDFVRGFDNKDNFFDVLAQLDANPMDIDVIKCNDDYAVNMINVGFDSHVVVKTAEMKKKKFIPSKFAYIAGLIVTLIKKPGVIMSRKADGCEEKKLELLLATFANGKYCGGGFYSNPHSKLDDGIINALFINDMSRIRFLSIVGKYKSGTHLDGTCDDIICESNAQHFEIELNCPTCVSVDGEIVIYEKLNLTSIHKAVRFLVPYGSSYLGGVRV